MARAKISAAVPERKLLRSLDMDGGQWVVVKPPTWVEEMARGQLLTARSTSFDDTTGMPITSVDVNTRQLWLEEIWLTFNEGHIDVEIEHAGEPPVVVTIQGTHDDFSRQDFMQRLVQLPSNVITEWHARVTEVVPAWHFPF